MQTAVAIAPPAVERGRVIEQAADGALNLGHAPPIRTADERSREVGRVSAPCAPESPTKRMSHPAPVQSPACTGDRRATRLRKGREGIDRFLGRRNGAFPCRRRATATRLRRRTGSMCVRGWFPRHSGRCVDRAVDGPGMVESMKAHGPYRCPPAIDMVSVFLTPWISRRAAIARRAAPFGHTPQAARGKAPARSPRDSDGRSRSREKTHRRGRPGGEETRRCRADKAAGDACNDQSALELPVFFALMRKRRVHRQRTPSGMCNEHR